MKLELIIPNGESKPDIIFQEYVHACILSGLGGMTIIVDNQDLDILEAIEEHLSHTESNYHIAIRPTEFTHYHSAADLSCGYYMMVIPKTPPTEGFAVLRCI